MTVTTKEVKYVKADPKGVMTGSHYLNGDNAATEGALAAGCRFAAGYPITPSTEVVERFSRRIPLIGGNFIQMEDELASSIAILGAVWGGAKALTVTSGPGFSLMMEHIGLGVMMETPVVFVNVQRGGPSTGLPTLVAQSDMMQARWGSHGDYEIIALAPQSPQETFDLMIVAFNLSEQFRVPVFVMMDEAVGHMTEKVIIPSPEEINIFPRRYTSLPPEEYLPYKPNDDLVPDIARAGDGYRFHTTGLTHDDRGYPAINEEEQERQVTRLINKIKFNLPQIIRLEEDEIDDARCIVVTYGISARVASLAVEKAHELGIKTGMLRLITVWPFPEEKIRDLAEKADSFVVVEVNLGQVFYEVERCAGGKASAHLCHHAGGGVHNPGEILETIKNSIQ